MTARMKGHRRVLGIELVQGPALLLASAFIAIVVLMLVISPSWAGNWLGLATTLRGRVPLVMPLVLIVATWAGGRERRLGTTDLLASCPRPAFHRIVMTWLAVTLGAGAGLFVSWLFGVAFVAPVASYMDAGWVISLLVCLLALAAVSALGVLFGQLIAWPLFFPLPGLALAVLIGRADQFDWLILTSSARLVGEGSETFTAFGHVALAVWFTAFATACLMLAGARRKWMSAIPATIAGVTASLIVASPTSQLWQDAAAADQLACAKVRSTTLCITQYREHLLDDYARIASPVLAEMRGTPAEPGRVNLSADDSLNAIPSIRGNLADPQDDELRVTELILESSHGCATQNGSSSLDSAPVAKSVAALWLTDSDFAENHRSALLDTPETRELVLGSTPPEREAWLKEYFVALGTCDSTALLELTRT